jgi:hypothetical protein
LLCFLQLTKLRPRKLTADAEAYSIFGGGNATYGCQALTTA